jgi:hypothetical protein
MSGLVPIEKGHWVLAYIGAFFQGVSEYDMPSELFKFDHYGAGFDGPLEHEILDVMQVERVMPRTYLANGLRQQRSVVIASSASREEMISLRKRLFKIGEDADFAIVVETNRLMSAFIANTRVDARHKIKEAVPHFFAEEDLSPKEMKRMMASRSFRDLEEMCRAGPDGEIYGHRD